MSVPGSNPPIPLELLKLRSATDTYMAVLADVEPFIGQASDVNRLRDSRWRDLYDEVVAATRQQFTTGTPVAIARRLTELLGEAS